MGRALLIDDAVPLLTLTGPGGVGKTRLALAIAQDAASCFSDGVIWVELASVTDPSRIPETVMSALDLVPRADERPIDYLIRDLRPRQSLLLLDNCEHLLDGVAEMATVLLARCPALQILATSRASLRIRGEHLLSVEPLSVPDETAPVGLAELNDYSAVTLLCERAHSVRHGFTLTTANAPAVAELCRRLDGLPLAVELAAAHFRFLPPEELLAQMTKQHELLPHAPRDLPQRQRSLHDTMSWSYNLLHEDDQWLLCHLAVCVGGWTLDAAAGVSGWPARKVLQGLERLHDQSLIQEMPGPQAPRFTMLETIREFALQHLSASGAQDDAHERHAGYYLALVDRLDAHVFEHLSNASQVLAILQAEYPNLRAAIAQFASMGAVDSLVRITGSLHGFWINQGLFREGQHWLELAVELGKDCPLPARVWAQVGLVGMLSGQHGRSERTWALLEEAQALAHASGDLLAIALAAEWRGAHALGMGALDLAETCYTEARVAFGALPPQAWISRNQTLVETGCAWTVFLRGDPDTAEAIGARALDQMRAFEQQNSAPYVYSCDALALLAHLAHVRGKFAVALEYYQEALRIAAQSSDQIDVMYTLIRLASLLDAMDRSVDAARVFGASQALCERLGVPFTTAVANSRRTTGANDPESQDSGASLDQRVLTDPLLCDQWAVGRARSTADAIADAIAIDPTASLQVLSPPPRSDRSPYDLTPREREVLGLLCERWTDPEIAEHFFISPRTVSSHVAHLFVKLGVNSRREAAALAAREGLL